ncbi:unnamed protein product, partial [Symbiodinium necroappetens]
DVAALVLEADPNAEAMVLWCAAPPCQDFSRIAKGVGHQGDRGRLFEDSVAFMDELRSILRRHRFAFLYENVEMEAAAAKVSSDALGVSPVFVCPSDFGWVSRPRLWWLSVDWTRVVTDPADGSPLEWAKRGRWDRLRLSAARVAADSFELGDLQFHPSVAQGRKLMPCATTPAPTDAMLQDSRGLLHLPPPDVKEQLHHIPAGYTAKAGADTKTRHRMVGNGWHWGVAARLLGILVMATWAKPVASGRAPSALPRQGTIPWLSQVWSRNGWDFSPPPRPTPALLGAGLDEDAHWAAATGMRHSLVGWPQLEPALEAVIRFRREWRHDLSRIRTEVLQELQEMVDDAAEDTTAWLATLPPHVRATYETSDRPRPFQGLIFDRLLRDLAYPATDDLRRDVAEGFDMLGRVRAAPGWKPRSDGRYLTPKGWT